MAGLLFHLLAGSALSLMGRYYYDDFFKGEKKKKERYLLIITCVFFSILPDIFIGVHIFFGWNTLDFHIMLHGIFLPISILYLLLLHYYVDIKDEPIVIMGLWAILLHLIMDFIIHEQTILL